MNIQMIANIATILEAIAVIASLIFIAAQIQQNTRLTRVANAQSVVENARVLATALAQDRQLAELWITGIKHYDDLDSVDQYRFLGFLTYLLNMHENAYYQLTENLLDERVYSPYESELKALAESGVLPRHWMALRSQFQSEFAGHVEKVLKEVRTSKP
ncbi:MAG: hypothetical protein JXB07_07935 [Anaerolineae bacterium]|nr:hypothetical protein [Anaerolineae bacterium]